MKKQNQFMLILFLGVAVLGAFALQNGRNRQPLVYEQATEKVVLTVDERQLTLKDIAFYVAYEEKTVQEKADIYDEDNPGKFWNIREQGVFVRTAAKKAILDMAVHDEIFYQMAVEDGLQLKPEEEEYLENEIYDFCSDLEEEQYEALGIVREDIAAVMYKIALANKYQDIFSQMQETAYEEYDFNGDAYQEMLEEHQYKVNEKVWDRIEVGRITLNK